MSQGGRIESRPVFSRQAVLAGTKDFLTGAGYRLEQLPQAGDAHPDLFAYRAEGRTVYTVAAVVRAGIGEAPEAYALLSALKPDPKDDVECVLVLPPVPEFSLIRFLTADKGRWFYEIKRLQSMMWLCNPERATMTCVLGAPRDRSLEGFFLHGYHPMDSYVSSLLTRELMKDEDF